MVDAYLKGNQKHHRNLDMSSLKGIVEITSTLQKQAQTCW